MDAMDTEKKCLTSPLNVQAMDMKQARILTPHNPSLFTIVEALLLEVAGGRCGVLATTDY